MSWHVPERVATKHVVVLGLMGVGKSTMANSLAAGLQRTHRDSDEDLEAQEKMTGVQLATERGVEHLHELEAQILLTSLKNEEPLVISAAASVVENEVCRKALQDPVVVWLDLAPEEFARRLGRGRHRRHVDETQMQALADRRAPMFSEVADFWVDAGQPADEVFASVWHAFFSGEN